MNWILATPMPLRLVGLFVLGALAGSLANLGIYRLAWHPRLISPWSRPDRKVPGRRPSDRIPIIGWLGLRRETALHGQGFWVRPMVVELLAGVGLAALYWWEIGRLGLLPPGAALPPVAGELATWLHAQFACHAVLIWLMIVASLIDVDEKIIPDTITVPGALLGLLVAAFFPRSLLPDVFFRPDGQAVFEWLHFASPNPWPGGPLDGTPQTWLLVVGMACWWWWCMGLMRRVWYPRHGLARAIGIFVARLRREESTWRILVLGLVGTSVIAAAWFNGGLSWRGFLSALVGMAAGGSLVWAVRVIGAAVLRREAMGFGDVTLMAMIGAFLGWQACLMIFFLAPLAALAVGLVVLVLHRENEIPYGPFLCLATVGLIVGWAPLWDWAADRFALGLVVPGIILACFALLAVLLALLNLILKPFR